MSLVKLSDFFQPLNVYTLSYYFLLLFFFDVSGTFIKKIICRPSTKDDTRAINWLIGLGFFVFLWFVLRFFIPPQRTPLIISFIAVAIVALPSYLKNHEIKNVLVAVWRAKVTLLIVAPFLPAVFVKASLPPYYSDEMAYQFISPSQLVDLDIWRVVKDFYPNLPRVFNYFFTLTFSLTRTYSVARLFHFSILVTAMTFTYQKLKKHFGLAPAFLFVFIFFSLPAATILAATVGFVDVATYSFVLIAVLSTLEFLLSRSYSSLFLSAIFWGMALGSKYTIIVALAVFGPIFLFVAGIKRLDRRLITRLVLIMLLFGGYWYLKNLIVFGNPIYPFLLPCYRFADICRLQSAKFFGGWTTEVTLANVPTIIAALFPGNKFLYLTLLVSPLLVLLNRNRKTKLVSLVLILAVLLEFLIIKYTSGFYVRYHQHLQLYLVILVVIQLANQYHSSFFTLLTKTFYLILFYFVITSFINTVRYTNSPSFITRQEIDYATGKIGIYDWINEKFPRVIAGLRWCENQPSGKRTALVRFDPDMIWYEYDGFMRSYLTNCYIDENLFEKEIPLNQFLGSAIQNKLQLWTVSLNKCLPDDQVVIKRHEEIGDARSLYLRRLNNIIVCNSTEVEPNLYHFDYQILKQ